MSGHEMFLLEHKARAIEAFIKDFGITLNFLLGLGTISLFVQIKCTISIIIIYTI